ncbi:DUF2271 domain-containing protein [Luteolibacter flavescens]|uniref:DUF2271 domain-containing protein n=1 Tax=Luteolibacter flavescens TaxID=1859460 RepID=A0ABT3FIG2_9BACT|nr:DUF2271 domain-containing protein [Luteolibacter flavescens]MCW1883139.1 DUF2271 domain-containing protein [Luteolibacter flavescens]
MKKAFLLLTPGLATAGAGEVQLTIEIPRLEVAEYHRPYIAAWLEKPDKSHAANLTVWYDTEMKNAEGEKWLKDIRQWWRKSGRSLKMPVDGVSSPTRPVGTHTVAISDKAVDMTKLAEGEYTLVVEASREVGGREMVRVPFKWDGKTTVDASGAGKTELGKVAIKIETQASN